MSKKISDNPSFQKLRTQAGQFSVLLSLIDSANPDVKALSDKLQSLRDELEEVARRPDDFNSLYGQRGWIAYESMDSTVMVAVIASGKKEGVDEGEKKLMEYYSADNVKGRLGFLREILGFKNRMRLIELALDDYANGRYHACIPVLLMMVDGIVSDLNKNFGLFSEGVDMSAWNSIAAHESGLGRLVLLLSKGKNKTNEESIDIPYRHGILHGRELAYDNVGNAAKCWGLLFAVRDWAVALTKKEQPEGEQNIQEQLEAIIEMQKSTKATLAALEDWKPREITLGGNIPRNDSEGKYQENSPEQAAADMFLLWKRNNYGKLAEMIYLPTYSSSTRRNLAGELRKSFAGKTLIGYELRNVYDQSASITVMKVKVTLLIADSTVDSEIEIRWIYANDKAEALVRGQANGRWFFVDSFTINIAFLK